ncbi:hypothetical protein ACQ4PT_039964 [Festuca glaucescens]
MSGDGVAVGGGEAARRPAGPLPRRSPSHAGFEGGQCVARFLRRYFLLHICAICGMMYARGNDEDEKVHRRPLQGQQGGKSCRLQRQGRTTVGTELLRTAISSAEGAANCEKKKRRPRKRGRQWPAGGDSGAAQVVKRSNLTRRWRTR